MEKAGWLPGSFGEPVARTIRFERGDHDLMGKIAPDHRLVALFCTLAAIRVLIYYAAFPFFNNVDETMHFDLVMKYGQGHIPRSLETMSPDSAVYIALFPSPEYLMKPGELTSRKK
jgi:hypothetical protein